MAKDNYLFQIKKDILNQFVQDPRILQYFIDGLVDKIYSDLSVNFKKKFLELEQSLDDYIKRNAELTQENHLLKKENEKLQVNNHSTYKKKDLNGYCIDYKIFTDICNTLYYTNRSLYDKLINSIKPQEEERKQHSADKQSDEKYDNELFLNNSELRDIFQSIFKNL